jgi:predicted transcriptional regulator
MLPSMANTITPREWREQEGLSLKAAAAMLGISGKNPGRTWQRYEAGDRKPPLALIADVEHHSKGTVTLASWAAIHRSTFSARRAVASPAQGSAQP